METSLRNKFDDPAHVVAVRGRSSTGSDSVSDGCFEEVIDENKSL